jgi:TrmH family RNA methyltransferase
MSVKALAGRSARVRSGRFLVEGPQGVREAVRCVPGLVRDVYVTEAAASRHAEILSDALAAHLRVHTASEDVVDAMSGDAQGILAVLDVLSPPLSDVLASGPRLVAVLAHVRDPGNAGTVIRTADAAGAGAVVLTAESVDVHNPKVVRSTAGSLFHIPVATGPSLADTVVGLRAAGLAVLAADGAGDHDLDDLLDVAGAPSGARAPGVPRAPRAPGVPDLSRPTAWVFGNEAWGLPDEDRALADAVVRVPIRGRAESLNLATAAAVCLYASSRAQR